MCLQLFVPGFPTPRHSGFHHLQGYHSKAHKSIYWGSGGGGGYRAIWRAAFPIFLFLFLLMVNNLSTGLGFWNVPATSSLELPDHLIYDITCHAPQTV